MPGIFGLVTSLPREQAESQLYAMSGVLRHEPFYTVGACADENLGVYVGWADRTDAIANRMPFRNGRGDVTLILSGELVPEPPPGHLVDRSAEDPSFPAALNGRFHGIRIDRTRRTSTLFNDRYGMHRLYYHQSKDAFYFAAEAKAILAVRPELRRMDLQALGELISCGCVLENRTIFPGIRVLPGASAWVLRRGCVAARHQYFEPREWEEQPGLEADAYYEELRDTFSRLLPRYFEGREPIAMSLTGGLDTRMVMAWQRRRAGSLPCYTFGGTYRECADVRVARQVASVCRQPHQVIGVGDDFLARFHTQAERTVYLTDGCADVSRAPDLYVNQRAREIAPTRMTGNYGGEVLRRVRAFKPMEPRPGLFQGELLDPISRARETYASVTRGHPLSFAVFCQAPWHHYGLLALEQTQLSLRSPFLDNHLVRTVFRAPASTLTNNDVCLKLIADGDPVLRAIPTDRGPEGGTPWACARRAAAGFMRLSEYAYDYGMPQWFVPIDRGLTGLRLERLFLGRQKFSHFRLWYRGVLAGYVREMLLDRLTLSRPYLNRQQVETFVNDHISGRGNYTLDIHKCLTLELVHRLFLDAQPVQRHVRSTASELARV
jgi:asparagine synthase (glutamine-hydrolysing)